MGGRTTFGLIIALVVLVLFFTFLALILGSPFNTGRVGSMNSLSIAMWIVMILAVFFIIAIILALIISAVAWAQWLGDFGDEGDARGRCEYDHHPRREEVSTVLDILNQRYARGEIVGEEYWRMKEEIERAKPRP